MQIHERTRKYGIPDLYEEGSRFIFNIRRGLATFDMTQSFEKVNKECFQVKF